ncbi:CMRF-35-like molecule 4 isoform X2 [Bubalus bubalis]|uniref:CMRF-35-like molecule 4 isoform X2 n=1 Tax=Bubalus bubalis TaxID=89462 RepID=UPI001E1B99CD|nr:CMRF-35-like molecule 4 isoform X2 [Bubalus bubalis]
MTPRVRAGWLPSALLLLQLPGCLSLSGPRRVMGIVGGSLRVECRYREEFINNTKYWCKHPCVLLRKTVETTESEREVRRGRLSIRDHPANLTFTVTLENLREEDGGLYRCGINVPLTLDRMFEVEVSVTPATQGQSVGPGEGNGACLLLCPHPCYSHRPREVHRLPRLSHESASAHLEHRIWSGDPRSRPSSSGLLNCNCRATLRTYLLVNSQSIAHLRISRALSLKSSSPGVCKPSFGSVLMDPGSSMVSPTICVTTIPHLPQGSDPPWGIFQLLNPSN